MGARLFNGANVQTTAEWATAEVADAMISGGLASEMDAEGIKRVARESYNQLAVLMKNSMIDKLVDKFPDSIVSTLGNFNDKLFSDLLNNQQDKDVMAVRLKQSQFQQFPNQKIFETLAAKNTATIPGFIDIAEPLEQELIALLEDDVPARPIPVRTVDSTREMMHKKTTEKYGTEHIPFLGGSVRQQKTAGRGSIFDHPAVQTNYRAQVSLLDNSTNEQLEEASRQIKRQRTSLVEERKNIVLDMANPTHVEETLEERRRVQKYIAHDLLVSVPDVTFKTFETTPRGSWTPQQLLSYNYELFDKAAQIITRVLTPARYAMDNVELVSLGVQEQLIAAKLELRDSVTVLSNQALIEEVRRVDRDGGQLAGVVAAMDSGSINQKFRKISAFIDTQMTDIATYNKEYYDDVDYITSLVEDQVVGIEAKRGEYGKINQIMESHTKEMEKGYLSNLHGMGMFKIADPNMRMEQQRMIQNAQQTMRNMSMVRPDAYSRNSAPGLGGNNARIAAFGSITAPNNVRELRDYQNGGGLIGGSDVTNQRYDRRQQQQQPGQPPSPAQQQAREDVQLSREAIDKARQFMNISSSDMKKLTKLQVDKSSRKLMITDETTGKVRHLTDKEKVEITRLIIVMTITIYKNCIKDMSAKEEAQMKQKLAQKFNNEENESALLTAVNTLAENAHNMQQSESMQRNRGQHQQKQIA